MRYEAENEAKASFDDVYTSPAPDNYIVTMARTGYEIGEQARPYCIAAAELLKVNIEAAWPVQMLDVGCSYGMGYEGRMCAYQSETLRGLARLSAGSVEVPTRAGISTHSYPS